ncbi:MAG: tetratricopeptide repeat protein [Gemmatimonadota bacterium]|nr:tetratricopeptide repeat protein [Gemmatimonadota bacterium]
MFPIKNAMKSAKSALALVLVLGACAVPPVPPPAEKPLVQREEVQPEESDAFQSLERAVAAAYEREQAMAERVRQLEASNAQLRQALRAFQSQSRVLSARLDSLLRRAPLRPAASTSRRAPQAAVTSDSGKSDAFNMYQGALYYYRHKQYDRALVEFDRLLQKAPMSEWSDNAQYWKGECYYGLRQYQQALIEFTKVFAFSNTDKADDSQLKIARCHLALDERDRALAALRKLVDEYPDSEYVSTAREQIKHLGG